LAKNDPWSWSATVDGEAPERGWSDLNGLSYSTREMGSDQQQVTESQWLAEIVAWENDSSQPIPFQSR